VKRPGSVTLLVGLILLVTATGLFLALVPVAPCPDCGSPLKVFVADEAVVYFPDDPSPPVKPAPPVPACSLCRDGRRITLARKWAGTRAWEGKPVAARAAKGFKTADSTLMLDKTGIRIGAPITRKIVEEARQTLLGTGAFRDVQIEVFDHAPTPGRVMVRTVVVE
jgi:hypothetical protein